MENPHHKSAIFGFSVDQLGYVPIFMSIVQKSDTLFPAWMRVTAQQQIKDIWYTFQKTDS